MRAEPILPTFETDHRNGLHNGAPCYSCALCKPDKSEPKVREEGAK